MINWRDGKAGFVGGLKYFIKGVFQFTHNVRSIVVVDKPTDLDGLVVKSLTPKLSVTSIRETLTVKSVNLLTVRSVS